LPSFATNERDSRRIILLTSAVSKSRSTTPHLSPLPASGARRSSISSVLRPQLLKRDALAGSFGVPRSRGPRRETRMLSGNSN
jgi:hypothetical protein